jgi:hypothetical protein
VHLLDSKSIFKTSSGMAVTFRDKSNDGN